MRRNSQSAPDEGFRSRATFLALAMLVLLAATAQAEELRGQVHLLAKGGKSPDRASDVRQAVVYFEPARPQPTGAARHGQTACRRCGDASSVQPASPHLAFMRLGDSLHAPIRPDPRIQALRERLKVR